MCRLAMFPPNFPREEAIETSAEVLVSSCVFCKNNLYQVASEDNSPIKVMDISQLLADCEFY